MNSSEIFVLVLRKNTMDSTVGTDWCDSAEWPINCEFSANRGFHILHLQCNENSHLICRICRGNDKHILVATVDPLMKTNTFDLVQDLQRLKNNNKFRLVDMSIQTLTYIQSENPRLLIHLCHMGQFIKLCIVLL